MFERQRVAAWFFSSFCAHCKNVIMLYQSGADWENKHPWHTYWSGSGVAMTCKCLPSSDESQTCPRSQWLVETGRKCPQRTVLTCHGNIIFRWNPILLFSLAKSLINLLILPVKRTREHAHSIIEHSWATVTASQRKEEPNPSKHNEQGHKQISGQSQSIQQKSLFVATKGCCFTATVKVYL